MAIADADLPASGLAEIRRSPLDEGRVELIVRRPAENEREVLEEGLLDLEQGLVGDTWRTRGSSRTSDGSAAPCLRFACERFASCAPKSGECSFMLFTIADAADAAEPRWLSAQSRALDYRAREETVRYGVPIGGSRPLGTTRASVRVGSTESPSDRAAGAGTA